VPAHENHVNSKVTKGKTKLLNRTIKILVPPHTYIELNTHFSYSETTVIRK